MSTLVTTALRHNTSASNNITLDSNGRVGIGTASPAGGLNVAGSRLLLGPSSELYALQVGFSQARVSAGQAYYIGATDSATPDMVFSNSAGLSQMSVTSAGNLQFNSGYGSVATAFGCRAWVNFNGTGTVAIRGSGNVSSITDHGVGDYTVNFTSAMPDTNYSVQAVAGDTASVVPRAWQNTARAATATGSVAIGTVNFSSSFTDIPHVFVAVFR